MNGENANSRPAANAAGRHATYRRMTTYIAVPDKASARRSNRLYVATGPSAAVMGHPNNPSSGIDVLMLRFAPYGTLRYDVKNGLWPCVIANGTQRRNHTSCT